MATDSHVRVLPVHVANKIAAGEVVERPASVLKELLENAVDAGATRIDVTVVQGGRKLVSVRDDGCGMSREDALLSLERQATSKIRDVDDIERIVTLGFRGEAIPSIAAVARFTLTTRRREEDGGTRLTVNAGTLAEIAACGAPPGTQVDVRDLFCNVPARRKFLRAAATEEARIREVFTVHALAHPAVGFSLTLDGRECYRLPPGATAAERIVALFGTSFSDRLLPIADNAPATAGAAGESDRPHVHGFVTLPDATAQRSSAQYVFVNGRPATAPIIAYAIKESYPHTLDEVRPALFLFIDLPPGDVDVNVHPAKREVRFRRPAVVKEAILTALADAFKQALPTAVVPSAASDGSGAADPGTAADNTTVGTACPPYRAPVQFSLPVQAPLAPQQPKEEGRDGVPSPSAAGDGTPAPSEAQGPATASKETTPAAASAAASPQAVTPAQVDALTATASPAGPWRSFKFLTQTASGYFLIETDAGLVTLNPQAALERVVYEKAMAVHDATTVSQPLLIPETIRLSPLESARLKSFADVLEGLGFILDDFGNDTWKIDAVPALLADAAAGDTLRSIAFDISEQGSRKGGVRWREELVARSVAKTCACRLRRFTPQEATDLVERLAACRMPYVCPRGKPVMIFVSNRELEHKFAR